MRAHFHDGLFASFPQCIPAEAFESKLDLVNDYRLVILHADRYCLTCTPPHNQIRSGVTLLGAAAGPIASIRERVTVLSSQATTIHLTGDACSALLRCLSIHFNPPSSGGAPGAAAVAAVGAQPPNLPGANDDVEEVGNDGVEAGGGGGGGAVVAVAAAAAAAAQSHIHNAIGGERDNVGGQP